MPASSASFLHRRPVSTVLLEVLPNTIVLTLTGLIVAYIFGVLVGAWLAWKRGSWIEGVAMPAVLALRAAPEFWLGMVLLALFVLRARLVPVRRRQQPGRAYTSNWPRLTSCDYLRHLVLPGLDAGALPAGPAAAADALQHARRDERGFHHHGAHEGLLASGAS